MKNGIVAWTKEGNGPAVLFLHSLGGEGSMWATTCAALSDRFTVITLDARGHGDTPADGPISVEQFARDALDLLDELELPSACVVGLSMGGQAAMHMALKAPGRIKALVLADT